MMKYPDMKGHNDSMKQVGPGRNNKNQYHWVICPIKNMMEYHDLKGHNDSMKQVVDFFMK